MLVSNEITLFNIQTHNSTLLRVSFYDRNAPKPIYGHTMVYYKRKILVFGGGYQMRLVSIEYSAINEFRYYEIPSNCNEKNIPICNWPCSQGTYEYKGNCFPCPKGTYENGTNGCIKCAKGMEQTTLGAFSSQQCIPCAMGNFSDKEGIEYCNVCPSYNSCPIGSTKVQQGYKYTLDSIQPESMESKSNKIEEANRNIYIAAGIFLFFIILYLLLRKNTLQFLTKIDIYNSNHNYNMGECLKLLQTSTGGLFTVILFIALIVLVGTTLSSFFIDRLVEKKGLIPYVVMQEKYANVNAEITVIVSFQNYKGLCIKQSNSIKEEYQECQTQISQTSMNIKLDKEKGN